MTRASRLVYRSKLISGSCHCCSPPLVLLVVALSTGRLGACSLVPLLLAPSDGHYLATRSLHLAPRYRTDCCDSFPRFPFDRLTSTSAKWCTLYITEGQGLIEAQRPLSSHLIIILQLPFGLLPSTISFHLVFSFLIKGSSGRQRKDTSE